MGRLTCMSANKWSILCLNSCKDETRVPTKNQGPHIEYFLFLQSIMQKKVTYTLLPVKTHFSKSVTQWMDTGACHLTKEQARKLGLSKVGIEFDPKKS